MVVLLLNDYVWNELSKDTALNAQYSKYYTQFGNDFKPFFPVHDNFTGDLGWDTECYVLYDSMPSQPFRQVFGEQRERVMYTLVGPIPQLFDFKEKIVSLFDFWSTTTIFGDEYRINDVNVTQMDRTRGRDTLRQTFSLTLLLEVNYHKCEI